MKWYAYYHDVNKQEIKTINIFDYYRFSDSIQKLLKKYNNKDEFAEELRRDLFYYFGSKCEYEVVIKPWVGGRGHEDIKVDIYTQVRNNWDVFVEYVWSHKPTKRKNRNKSVGKCSMAKNYCKHSSNGYCVADDETAENCSYLSAISEIARLTVLDNKS